MAQTANRPRAAHQLAWHLPSTQVFEQALPTCLNVNMALNSFGLRLAKKSTSLPRGGAGPRRRGCCREPGWGGRLLGGKDPDSPFVSGGSHRGPDAVYFCLAAQVVPNFL